MIILQTGHILQQVNMKIIIIKLGGSLITDKSKPFTARLDVMRSLAIQIKNAQKKDSSIRLIIGNGGGSFPHVPATKYKMKQGIKSARQIKGCALTQDSAAKLNRIIVSEFLKQGINAVSINPSSMVITKKGKIQKIFLDSLLGFLEKGLTPVMYGDIVYDTDQGASIVSTEVLINTIVPKLLSKKYHIQKIIQNGRTGGVYDKQGKTIPHISQKNYSKIKKYLFQTEGFDVTGGMVHKIKMALLLAKKSISTQIINGAEGKNYLQRAILGDETFGTLITK